MECKAITIDDKAIFETYLKINEYHNSEYNFTTLFAWQEAYKIKYTILHNCLCIFGEDQGEEYAYFPLGEKHDVSKALCCIFKYFKEKDRVFRLISLSEKMLCFLREKKLEEQFDILPQRGFFDYIYKREKLVTFSGKKLNAKRNHLNYFYNNYKYEFMDITNENEAACQEKLSDLIFSRSLDSQAEFIATMKILKNRETIGLIGKVLYVQGEIVGIILGQYHHGMALIEIAKADIDYRGASVALFQLFLKDNLTDCEEVNLMEDLGLEGLRKVKLSYKPEYLIEKFSLIAKPDLLIDESELCHTLE